MTDPLRPRNRPEPPRAAPLQPDKPGSGRRQERPGEEPQPSGPEGGAEDSLARARERESNAIDNVREGYD
jgi:hypothetical protein